MGLAARAELDRLRGDCRGAIAEAERAVASLERAYDAAHPELVAPLVVVGRCAFALGRPAAAQAPLERALLLRVSLGGRPADLHDLVDLVARARTP